MKKKIIYIALLIFFLGAIAAIVYKYESDSRNSEPEYYTLLPRKGAAAQAPEWMTVKQQAYKLLQALKSNPSDKKSLIQVATLYIQEARASGNYAYYDKAALKYINDVLEADSSNP